MVWGNFARVLLGGMLCMGTALHASASDAEVAQAAQTYQRLSGQVSTVSTQRPDPTPCVKFICGTKFSCTYDGTLKAANACSGNDGDGCVSFICGTKFSCTYDGAIKAAVACKGNVGGNCVEYVCTKFSCTFDGAIKAALSCGGNG